MVGVVLSFVASWSGGKESALSLYRAINQGIKISHTMSFVSSDGRSMSHALRLELLKAQSQALGIPLATKEVTWETYEQGFKELVNGLKPRGLEGCVFGDVWVAEHKEWTERVCKELEIKALSPLFGEKPENLFREFIDLGFEAIVVVVKKEYLGDEWLGRKLDQDFLSELLEMNKERKVDVLGEMGEYHTFVYDGPIFKKRIIILETQKVSKNGYTYLDITNFKLSKK